MRTWLFETRGVPRGTPRAARIGVGHPQKRKARSRPWPSSNAQIQDKLGSGLLLFHAVKQCQATRRMIVSCKGSKPRRDEHPTRKERRSRRHGLPTPNHQEKERKAEIPTKTKKTKRHEEDIQASPGSRRRKQRQRVEAQAKKAHEQIDNGSQHEPRRSRNLNRVAIPHRAEGVAFVELEAAAAKLEDCRRSVGSKIRSRWQVVRRCAGEALVPRRRCDRGGPLSTLYAELRGTSRPTSAPARRLHSWKSPAGSEAAW